MSSALKVVAAVVALGLLATPTWAIGITNGDFGLGLTGWSAPFGSVSVVGGWAVLDESTAITRLEQQFVIPGSAVSLSFDYALVFAPGELTGGPPDSFTASLLGPTPPYNPLRSTPGYSDFFYEDSSGSQSYDSSIVTVVGSTVTLDLSGLSGQDALLSFDLFGYDDGYVAQAKVDNVKTTESVIPEPITAVGISLTLAAAGMYARRRRS